MRLERRIVHVGNLEVRATDDGRREYRGDAIRFDESSENLGGFVEFVDADCEIEAADVRHLINHDANLVLGRTTAGTTQLVRSGEAVTAITDLPDTSYARDLEVSIERKDVDQMSFGFRVVTRADGSKGDTWDFSVKPAVRHLRAIELSDVSTVTFPAYPTTTAEVRSLLMQHGVNPSELRADGAVAWDSEAGFADYQADISASLPVNPDGAMNPYGWVQDVAMDGSAALVSWYAESDSDCQYYVVPVVLDADGEPSAGAFETWAAVEQEYVLSDDRALRELCSIERRAGKTLSAKNAEHVTAIAEHASALMSSLSESDKSDDTTDTSESNAAARLDFERRLLAIREAGDDPDNRDR